jgi:RND family efflux transporter MFP subunit
MIMSEKRQLRPALLALILTGLTCALVYPTGGVRAEDAATVTIIHPEPASKRVVELPGSFEPYETALLHAKVTGYVSKVHVDIGQRVSAGTPLVQLDIPEMEPALGRARADVLADEAALEKTEAQVRRDRLTYQRLSELQAREPLAVTQQDVDMAAADLQVSEAAVKSAKAEISVARAKLEELVALMAYAVIRAPFDGVVAQRFVDRGALVVSGADGGDPVLEVAGEDRLRLVLAVPEPIVPQTRAGIPAEITVDALPGRTFSGTVTRCAGPLTRDTRTMRAEIDMDDHGGLLRPGMYATVALQLGGDEEQLSLPASLIRHDGDGRAFVWTVRDATVVKTLVEIARDDGASAVVRAGLRSETVVVLEGPADLHEGQPVSIIAGTEVPR